LQRLFTSTGALVSVSARSTSWRNGTRAEPIKKMYSPNGDGLEVVTDSNEVVRVPQVVLLLRHQLRTTTVSRISSNQATHGTPAVGSALAPAPTPENKANPTSNRSARTESTERHKGEEREVRGP